MREYKLNLQPIAEEKMSLKTAPNLGNIDDPESQRRLAKRMRLEGLVHDIQYERLEREARPGFILKNSIFYVSQAIIIIASAILYATMAFQKGGFQCIG